jgi:hypothetical protein
MSYTKTVWRDRVVQNPLTYTLQDNGDGTTTLIPAEGTIIDPGTPITAAALNNLEKQYDEATTLASWTNVTFENNYSNYVGTYAPVSYRKKPDGEVRLRGAARSVGIGEGFTIFTLPVGIRPPYDMVFPSIDNKNNSIVIYVRANGTVTAANLNPAYDVDTAFISFDGISFDTN